MRPPGTGVVGVGVMDYHGNNDDRGRAAEIHAAYLETVKRLVSLLVEEGREVRLFTGDKADVEVLEAVLAAGRAGQREGGAPLVVAERVSTLADLMRVMAGVDVVVATRYHNVLSALKLAIPTLSISYARKNDVLMANMGMGAFCEPARSIDFERLIELFRNLESRREGLVETMNERNRTSMDAVDRQFAALSELLLADTASEKPASAVASRR